MKRYRDVVGGSKISARRSLHVQPKAFREVPECSFGVIIPDDKHARGTVIIKVERLDAEPHACSGVIRHETRSRIVWAEATRPPHGDAYLLGVRVPLGLGEPEDSVRVLLVDDAFLGHAGHRDLEEHQHDGCDAEYHHWVK